MASTTRTPGRPSAKRPYQSTTSGVASPSSVDRQGTMAGTQVLVRAVKAPTRIGAKRRLITASSALGQPGSGRG